MQKASRQQAYEDDTAIETGSDESEVDERANLIPGAEADDAGEEGWRNKEGERLGDFGVDEVADFYDEDDLPLAEIIRKQKGRQD